MKATLTHRVSPSSPLMLATSFAAALVMASWSAPGLALEDKELPAAATVEIDFATHIEPILSKNCYRCHGDKKQKSEYRLDSREAALKGGEIGVAIMVGDSAKSPLIHYVAGLDEDLQMPPSGDPLTAEQIGLLRAWIDQGMKWPEGAAKAELVDKPREEKATYEAHSGLVTSVAFAPGSGVLISAGGQSLPFRPGELKLWDVASGEQKAAFEGIDSAVWGLAVSSDGARIAAGTYGKKVMVWDAASGEAVATLEGHKNWVTAVAFSPDGATLATGSEDTTIKLWNLADRKEKATLEGHKGTVRDLAFSPDGQTLASASLDGTIKLWNPADGKEKATLEGHKDGVFALAFSPGGELLASGSADTQIFIWEVSTGKKFKELSGHGNWVVSLAFSPNGKTLASGGYDSLVKLWDPILGVEQKTYEGHESAVWSVDFDRGGSLLASGSQDGTVKLWSAKVRRTARF